MPRLWTMSIYNSWKAIYGYWLLSKLVGTAPYMNDTQGIMFCSYNLIWGMFLTWEQQRYNQVRLRQDLTRASLNYEYLMNFMHSYSYEYMKYFWELNYGNLDLNFYYKLITLRFPLWMNNNNTYYIHSFYHEQGK